MASDFWNITTAVRRPDQLLAERARADAAKNARIVGAEEYGRGVAGLRNRGLGNAGAFLNLASRAGNLTGQTYNNFALPYAQYETDFTEKARQFDTQMGLALKELFLRNKWNGDARKFNFGQFMGNLVGAGGQAAAGYFGRG